MPTMTAKTKNQPLDYQSTNLHSPNHLITPNTMVLWVLHKSAHRSHTIIITQDVLQPPTHIKIIPATHWTLATFATPARENSHTDPHALQTKSLWPSKQCKGALRGNFWSTGTNNVNPCHPASSHAPTSPMVASSTNVMATISGITGVYTTDNFTRLPQR